MWQGGIYVIIKNLNKDGFKAKSPSYSFTQLSLSLFYFFTLFIFLPHCKLGFMGSTLLPMLPMPLFTAF